METAPVLCLNGQQLVQLIAYCAEYRSYLWQSFMPTPGRNQAIRGVQTLQGRLEKAQEQERTDRTLLLTGEEKTVMKQLLSGLLQLYGNAPPSEWRTRKLAEVAGLRLQVERAWRQTQEL